MTNKIKLIRKKPEIRYPGSAIQQNHGEALDHGILVWDIETNSAEFVQIENEYGYVTLETQGDKIVNAPARMPQKPRIRIKFNDTSAADMKRLIATLRKKYQVEDITIQRTIGSAATSTSSSLAIGNVRDIEYQNVLLTEYIDNNFPQATSEEQDAIRHINRTINSKLPAVESIRHTTWHPISFEFDNMFSYGEGNVLNFENLSDVCGLFAANTSGKSSLLDAITYTIFDKCSKTGKASEVLNNKKTWFRGVFRFEMNGIQYTIERQGTKKKDKHVKVDVNFSTDTENLNGEERSDTNKSIRRYLGTYDDFILTAFSLQADNNNFIEKTQRERKDLLSQFLDITVFEQLYQLAADEIKETAGKLKEYKKTDFADLIISADSVISENQDAIQALEEQEDKAQETRNDLQNHIVTLIESKLPTTYDGPDIDALTKQETVLTKKIETLQQDIETAEQEITTLTTDISQIKQQVKTQFDITVIQERVAELNVFENEMHLISNQITTQQRIIDAKETQIQHLDSHEYDPNCQYCTSNIFIQQAIEAQDTIDTDRAILIGLELQHDDASLQIASLTQYQTQYETLIHLKDDIQKKQNVIDKKELRLQLLESELQTRESELETCLERQDSFNKNVTAISHNRRVDLKISLCKDDIEMFTEDIKTIQTQIKSGFGAIEVAKTQKATAMTNLDVYRQLETEYKAYEYYLDAVQRNGIPYEVISKAVPKIEAEINNVLNQIVDFNMVLNTDGKNINGYIIYDEDNYWPLELTSGMERFISSLAIRIALINVSALPRPNFIAIDEGFGTLDSNHIASLVNLFEYLRTKFDFSIIISHVDSMKDMVDSFIAVDKINGYSQINHA